MCRSVIFPPFFDSLYWGMLIYFPSWNQLDIVHSYLTCCEGCICCLFFPIWAFISQPMTSRLCFGILRTREDSSSLPLNVAAIILGCILSMLLSVFNALGPMSIPTPPTVALTEFFHADTVTSIHPLPVSWYLISSVWVYRFSCMQIMSILCSTADAVSSGCWPILFRVLTLNVAICIVC